MFGLGNYNWGMYNPIINTNLYPTTPAVSKPIEHASVDSYTSHTEKNDTVTKAVGLGSFAVLAGALLLGLRGKKVDAKETNGLFVRLKNVFLRKTPEQITQEGLRKAAKIKAKSLADAAKKEAEALKNKVSTKIKETVTKTTQKSETTTAAPKVETPTVKTVGDTTTTTTPAATPKAPKKEGFWTKFKNERAAKKATNKVAKEAEKAEKTALKSIKNHTRAKLEKIKLAEKISQETTKDVAQTPAIAKVKKENFWKRYKEKKALESIGIHNKNKMVKVAHKAALEGIEIDDYEIWKNL